MTNIEKVIKELSDLYHFYYKIKTRKFTPTGDQPINKDGDDKKRNRAVNE